VWTQTVLLWLDQGYAVVVDHRSSCPAGDPTQISPGDRVAQVVYFEVSRFPALLRTQSLFGPDSEAVLVEAAPWTEAELAP